ncbi:hypothetical protein EW026_g5579, partial [Hermanssonia centrifuga]
MQPPDSVVTQLDIYTEEKFEDEEDLRERSLANHRRTASDSEVLLQDLINTAKQYDELYPEVVRALNSYRHILEKDSDISFKSDIIFVLNKFTEHASHIDNFDDSWCSFVKQFADSVRHITGQSLEAGTAQDGQNLIVGEELDSLRMRVDELSEERSRLQNELSQQVAELSTLRTLPLSVTSPTLRNQGKGNGENFHGLVQRLVQKEKQVIQLQGELERLKAQNPSESRELEEKAKRERDRAKWNTLMEEIAKSKLQNDELQTSFGIKEKEVTYLKRALESVYSRFRSREENREPEVDAQLMAARAIEDLTQKDDEIKVLNSEIEKLKAELAVKPRFITEQDFKHRVPPPPPPPPVKPKRAVTAPAMENGTDGTSTTLPSPPPPPPPPPGP